MCEAACVAVVLVPLLAERVEGTKSGPVVFTGRAIVVTKPFLKEDVKLGIWKRQLREWVSFDLTVSSIAKASSLKFGSLPSTRTTWEEKEAQDPPEHLAVDEPYQCSEAHTATAEVEDS